MFAVQKWAKDKPNIVRLTALQLVPSIRDYHEEFRQLKVRRFASKKFPLPDLPSWFKMYRSHRRALKHVEAVWSAIVGIHIAGLVANLLQASQQVQNLDKETILAKLPTSEEQKEIVQFISLLLSAAEKDFESNLANTPVNKVRSDRVRKLFADTPFDTGYFVFVIAPCWLLYRMPPTLLYRKARLGDFDALEKLLRLDQLMLHDPAIGKRVIECRFNHSMSKYRKLLKAATDPPKGTKSIKNLLLSQLGLLSAMSHLTGKPLIATDIIQLVEAIDQDYKTNFIGYLPEDSRSLTRELQPDRNLWRQIFNPDIKKRTSCPTP